MDYLKAFTIGTSGPVFFPHMFAIIKIRPMKDRLQLLFQGILSNSTYLLWINDDVGFIYW